MELITDVITVTAASAAQTAKIQFHQAKILITVKGIYLWQFFLPICQPYGLYVDW
jgi:hypothetical protein